MELENKDKMIYITTKYIKEKSFILHIINEKDFDIEFTINNDRIDVEYIRCKFPYWKETFTIDDKFVKILSDKESTNRSKQRNYEMFENIQKIIIIILKRILRNMIIVQQ